MVIGGGFLAFRKQNCKVGGRVEQFAFSLIVCHNSVNRFELTVKWFRVLMDDVGGIGVTGTDGLH